MTIRKGAAMERYQDPASLAGPTIPTVNGHDGQPDRRAGDRQELRRVLGRFATGITVVTAGHPTPQGMTVNAFTSVSLEPPLVLICVAHTAAIHATVLAGRAFAVCVLSASQEHLARYFANHARPRDEREFDVVAWTPGEHTGAPLVAGALAWIECRLVAVYAGGDHSIFLGEVLASGRDGTGDALLFYGGEIRQLPVGRP